MMQVIDEAYVQAIIDLPDGTERLTRWIHRLVDDAERAACISVACVEQIQPLKRQNRDLQMANSREVFARRDLRVELEAQLDAAHAELDSYRRDGLSRYNRGIIEGTIGRLEMAERNEANDEDHRGWCADMAADLRRAIGHLEQKQ